MGAEEKELTAASAEALEGGRARRNTVFGVPFPVRFVPGGGGMGEMLGKTIVCHASIRE